MSVEEYELVRAAKDGQLPTVQRLLGLGVAIDALDAERWTALHRAAYEGHEEVVELLLEKGASVTARTPDGQTPLMMAAYKGSVKSLDALLAKSAAVNDEDHHGWTPLMFVTIYLHGKTARVVELARHLIESGARINATNHAGWNAAMMAAKNEMYDLAELLIHPPPARSGASGSKKTAFVSLIDFVSSLGREFPADADSQIEALVANGCNINESREGKTPLDCAARQDNVGAVKSLVKHGADVNAQNPMGRTSLLNAAVWGKADALQALLECGADPNIACHQGGTALRQQLGHHEDAS